MCLSLTRQHGHSGRPVSINISSLTGWTKKHERLKQKNHVHALCILFQIIYIFKNSLFNLKINGKINQSTHRRRFRLHP